MTALLDVDALSVRRGGETVVSDVSFQVRENEWLMVAGPNGADKTTILSAIAQSLPYEGRILFRGAPLRELRASALARAVGVLTQTHHAGYAFTVDEVVRLGRYAYLSGAFRGMSGEDEAMVERALERTGMAALRARAITSLSGGELQRAFLAQVFAQDPKLLLLDEPANHLDPVYQKQIFDLVSIWAAEPGRAAIAVVHDLSLAKAYGTRAMLLEHGRIASQGSAQDAFSPELLRRVYGMDVAGWMRGLLRCWE